MRKAIIELQKLDPTPEQWGSVQTGRFKGQSPSHLLQRCLAIAAPTPGDNSPTANERKKAAIADRKALLAAARTATNDSELHTLYKQAFGRWERAFPNDPDGTPPQWFENLAPSGGGRIVIGLGVENVLETGLRLHQTYGLPVIPGSALKGLTSHYCDQVWGQQQLGDAALPDRKLFRREGSYHDLLFGFTRTEDADAGAIVFHDAWITPASVPNCLCLDVMTPHHPDWQIEGKKAPTDFDSPNPISFLSVTGTFRVGVSWNGPADHPQAKNWIELTFGLLKEALKEWGIGGKTSSGYGRLEVPPPPPPPPPWQLNDLVTVKVISRTAVAGGKFQFKVQEEGVARVGIINAGIPPSKLPDEGETITVYRNNREPSSPLYRWDRLPPAGSPRSTGNPKQGPRPRR